MCVLMVVVGNVLFDFIECNVWIICDWVGCMKMLLVYVGCLCLFVCDFVMVVNVYGKMGFEGVELYVLCVLFVVGYVVLYFVDMLSCVVLNSVMLCVFGLLINIVIVLVEVL